MSTRFPNGIQDVKAADFSGYNLAQLSDADLGLIGRKSMDMIVTGSHETEAAKAMLQLISTERNFRAATVSRRAFFVWSLLTVLALIIVGIVQAYAIYATSYAPSGDDERGGSCEQNQDYSI
jgi:hypothetical protein